MDSRLSWKFHIHELTKKLSRAIGLLYKICAYSPQSILISLYFAIFHSHLTYGLPVWGFADQNLIDRIVLLQKKAVRIITSADYRAHTKPIFKETNILSLADQRHYQVCSLMWDLDHNSLPPTLSSYFTKHGDIHEQHTRLAHHGKFKVNKTNTVKYGGKSFQVQGSVTLNQLKDLNIYKDANDKESFLRDLKKSLINNY